MARTVKETPRLFATTLVEYEQRQRLYWANKLDEKGERVLTDENIALLYVMKKKLEDAIEEDVIKAETELLQRKGDDDWQIPLPEYGKKVVFDKEAMNIFIEDMNEKDFKKYDEKCNEKYLASKGK